MLEPEVVHEIIVQRHNKAEIFVTLFFMAVNCVFLAVAYSKIGFDFNNKSSPRNKVFYIIIVDFFLRIGNYFTATFEYSLGKEIFSTFMATIQFYMIIKMLNQIFNDKNSTNSITEDIEIKMPELSAMAFFALAFVSNISATFSLIQYICASISIAFYIFYVTGKIKIFLKNIEKNHPTFAGNNYTTVFPFFISLYFWFFYSIKIILLTIEWKLYISYLDMASVIFREAGKYLTFSIIMIIYYLYNQYVYIEEATITKTVAISNEKDEEKLNH